jgi:hypothetical protein
MKRDGWSKEWRVAVTIEERFDVFVTGTEEADE